MRGGLGELFLFFQLLSAAPGSLRSRPPPLTPPARLPGPYGAPSPTRAQKLWRGLTEWGMPDWRRGLGSCPQAGPLPQGWGAESDSAGTGFEWRRSC